ncbi:hypothetical protein YC2023_108425 [Brassica napus]
MCGALHELQSCSLTSGRSGGVLHVSWTCSQPCGARGAAVHSSGAMRSDTLAATNLKLIGWCLLYKDHDPFSFHSSIPFKSELKKWSAPREGSGQLKINQLKINSDGKQVNVASSVQSAILYDCDAEALSNSIRPSQSYSPTIKWRCFPRLVQFHGFRSVEVLLDIPPKCPKNCPAAKGDSVQISLSRRVSFFMMKSRLCPSQDQSSPVQSSQGVPWVPVIFKDSFSAGGWTIWYVRDPPILGLCRGELVFLQTSDPKDCGLSCGDPKDCGPRSVESSFFWPLWVRNPRDSVAPIYGVTSSDIKVVDIKAMLYHWFPLLEARSWQEAKSNLVTVALGKDDRIAWCWTLGPPAGTVRSNTTLGRGRGVKFVTLTGSSLTRHVALPDLGVGLDGQSCSCLIVGWPVWMNEMRRGRGLYIGDTSQSASGWWQPVCRSAWLRTHARRHLVLHMAGCMSRTHAGRHHSSQMSGCMTGAHARRHTSSHMSISILRFHASRHLVLGDPPRASTCQAACAASMHGDTSSFS